MHLRVLTVAALAVALPIQDENAKRDDGVVVLTTTQGVGWAQLFGLGTTTTAAAAAPTIAATTSQVVVAPTTQAAVAATTAAAATQATAPAAAPVSTPATTSKGFFSSLLGFFDGGSSGSSGSGSSTPAATTTPASTSSTSSSRSSWLSNLFLGLFGSSSSSTPATTAAASPVVASPAVASPAVASPLVASPVASSSSSTSSSGGLLSNIFGSSSDTSETPGFTGLVTVDGTGTGSTGSESELSASVALNHEISQVAAYAEEGAGITYSPYTKDGQCKTASEVALDIKMLLAYPMIRLYSVDCSGIQNVVAAMSSLQKLFLGVWSIDNLPTDLSNMQTQVLSGSRGWSAVHTVAIGNELVNAGTKTVAQIKTAVSTARSWFKSNALGYSGYIVSVDTLAAVMADASMCDISDYLAVNCHPYFSGIEALTSGTWLKAQVQSLQSHCGNGKQIMITESGWPTYGNTVGDAVPSQENQLLAIKGLATVMGDQVIMFTTYNDYWKAPGSWNVEQHWGIYGDPSA
ncbi:CIC11C00000002593 [Sungouiella intermedia]|uniref:CIC11C00000002593 n=1 Tax=Sungouiella intermedia TaxID=45354 RepID=A0A1L0BHA8_9ASCO|nr:CIC11C00000002593 [[Candida] intermedia]